MSVGGGVALKADRWLFSAIMRFKMPPPHHPPAFLAAETHVLCANCAAEVSQRFCGRCGQSRHDHSRSVFEVVRELIEHHLFLDGKMMMTLVALLFRPGLLTRAFIEGRRVRFVSPIRLYLFASFAFFLALWMSGFAMIQFHVPHQVLQMFATQGKDGDAAAAPAQGEGADGPVIEILRPVSMAEPLPDAIRSRLRLTDDLQKAAGESEEARKILDFSQRLADGLSVMLAHPRALNPVLDEWLPRLLILSLPFVALLLALFGTGRGLYFVDHIAFALHLQAFSFVLGLIVIGLRVAWPELELGWLLLLVVAIYCYFAYLRTYPGNWLWAGVKLGIIGSVYGCTLLFGLVGLLVYGVSTLPGA
jgi:hypothetical protein